LLKEDRDKASRIGNSMQTKDNEYKLKLSMIFFDKKNNHLRSPETAQQPRGKEKDRKAAEYESSCKKKVASFEQLVKSIDNHKPE
jgi:isopentenyl diphosphate isomerase/L-lactate dehydrogenase-like FMN-dependent dehydrogenase